MQVPYRRPRHLTLAPFPPPPPAITPRTPPPPLPSTAAAASSASAVPPAAPPLHDSERFVANLHRAYSELRGEPSGAPIPLGAVMPDMIAYNGGKVPECLA